jgi:pyrroline-5-carboxylate reductase
MPVNVGVIGAGHIARAMGEGWSRPGLSHRPRLTFADVAAECAVEAAAATGGEVAASAVHLVTGSDIIIVAVRPQHVESVLADIGPLLGDRALVSVAAGFTLDRLVAALPAGARVGRVMPNIAASLGLGVFLLVEGSLGESAALVRDVLGMAGIVVDLPEEQFDVATAVAGCMPGMLASIVDAFAAAGADQGLAPAVAQRIAVAGVHGAAALIAREGDPAAVSAAAATPGGMTAAGIAALEEHLLGAAVNAAVAAAPLSAQTGLRRQREW